MTFGNAKSEKSCFSSTRCAFEGCANRMIWALQRDSEVSVNSQNSRFLLKRVNFSPFTVKHVNLYQLTNTQNTGSQVNKVVGGMNLFGLLAPKYETNKKLINLQIVEHDEQSFWLSRVATNHLRWFRTNGNQPMVSFPALTISTVIQSK